MRDRYSDEDGREVTVTRRLCYSITTVAPIEPHDVVAVSAWTSDVTGAIEVHTSIHPVVMFRTAGYREYKRRRLISQGDGRFATHREMIEAGWRLVDAGIETEPMVYYAEYAALVTADELECSNTSVLLMPRNNAGDLREMMIAQMRDGAIRALAQCEKPAAAELIRQARADGIVLSRNGDRLRFDAPHGLPDDLRVALAEHKADILTLLDALPTLFAAT